jgi:hypothetical protein
MGAEGTEIEFADGKFVVDDVYAGPIREATNGDPSRYTFKHAMKLVGPVLGKDVLRRAQSQVISDHFSAGRRSWG